MHFGEGIFPNLVVKCCSDLWTRKTCVIAVHLIAFFILILKVLLEVSDTGNDLQRFHVWAERIPLISINQ